MEKFRSVVSFLNDKKVVIVVCIISFFSFLIACFGIYRLCWSKTNEPLEMELMNEEDDIKIVSNEDKDKEEEIITYSVEIKGEVVKPGVYTLDCNKRVIDVVNKAKGFTKNADSSVINLSKKIKDEMVIIVYSKKQVNDFIKTKEKEEIKQEICKQEYKVENDACLNKENVSNNNINNSVNNGGTSDSSDEKESSIVSNDTDKKAEKVSLNTATLDQLMSLNGIGESKAQSIIDYRVNEGKFNSIEDVMKVSGIGEALFEKIKDNITV